jgi:NADH-quinone oxidoreductase subunit L
LTFWGDFRGWTLGRPSLLARQELAAGGKPHHDDLATPGYPPHESPWQMTVPLIILGTCSIFVGLIFDAGPIKVSALHSMDAWLEPVFAGVTGGAVKVKEGAEGLEWPLAAGGVLAFVLGSGLAYWMYIMEKGEPAKRMAAAAPGLHQLVYEKWHVDELYDATVVAAVDALADTSSAWDQTVVDGAVAKVPSLLVSALGSVLRLFQTGVVHFYAMMMAIGLFAFGWFFAMPHARLTVDTAADTKGDYVVQAAPGMGYTYRWDSDADGKYDNDKFSEQATVKIHLAEGASQKVKVEVQNAFGLHATAEVPLARATPPKVVQVGQN